MADSGENNANPDQSLFPVFILSMATMVLIPMTIYVLFSKSEGEESAQERSEAFKRKGPYSSSQSKQKFRTGTSSSLSLPLSVGNVCVLR